jgi:transposase
MYAVELYTAVRQFVFVEGKSRREAARVFGLHRDTISKMCRFSAPPGYVRNKPPGKPKLGPLIPVIDAILAADVTAPWKQRHTAKRIFEHLQGEHGYTGGHTVVKDYVRSAKLRSKETFVPLAHPPGHAQVDFGEAIAVIGGPATSVVRDLIGMTRRCWRLGETRRAGAHKNQEPNPYRGVSASPAVLRVFDANSDLRWTGRKPRRGSDETSTENFACFGRRGLVAYPTVIRTNIGRSGAGCAGSSSKRKYDARNRYADRSVLHSSGRQANCVR